MREFPKFLLPYYEAKPPLNPQTGLTDFAGVLNQFLSTYNFVMAKIGSPDLLATITSAPNQLAPHHTTTMILQVHKGLDTYLKDAFFAKSCRQMEVIAALAQWAEVGGTFKKNGVKYFDRYGELKPANDFVDKWRLSKEALIFVARITKQLDNLSIMLHTIGGRRAGRPVPLLSTCFAPHRYEMLGRGTDATEKLESPFIPVPTPITQLPTTTGFSVGIFADSFATDKGSRSKNTAANYNVTTF